MPKLTRTTKAAIIATLREGNSLNTTCRNLSLKPDIVRRRLDKNNTTYDPLFAEAVAATQTCPDDPIIAKVEQAFMDRLLEGKATCSDYTFWLCNRAPERWRVPQKAYLDPADQTGQGKNPAEMTAAEMLNAYISQNGETANGPS